MPLLLLAPTLTPHGRLTLVQDDDAAAVEAELAQRLQNAFARGSGHGLPQLDANEIGVALPPTLSYWREFAAQESDGFFRKDKSLRRVGVRSRDSALPS